MRFAVTEWLWLALCVPVFAVCWFLLREKLRAQLVSRFVGTTMAHRLYSGEDPFFLRLRSVLLTAGATFLVLTLARPLGGLKDDRSVEARGLDVVLVIDISRSMLATDAKPDRLALVQQSVSRLFETMGPGRVGAIVFRGKAAMVAPLTFDREAVRLVVNTISPDVMGASGTAIGEALTLAEERFKVEKGSELRAVIVLSDGENLEGDPVFAARNAAQNGLRIFTAGVGTSEGSRIPLQRGEPDAGFVRERGREVLSRLDAAMLRQIALAGRGEFIPIETGDDLANFYKEKMQSLSDATAQGDLADYHDLSMYPLLLALICFVTELLVRTRRRMGISIPRTTALAVLYLSGMAMAVASPEAAIKKAENLISNNEAASATAILQDALIQYPREPALLYGYATALYAAKDFSSSEQVWARLALEFPEFHPGRVAFGRANAAHRAGEALLSAKRAGEAEERFREVLTLNSEAAERGGVRKPDLVENHAHAEAQLNRALRQNAQELASTARGFLGRKNLETGLETFRTAVSKVDEAAELTPKDQETLDERSALRADYAGALAGLGEVRAADAEKTLATSGAARAPRRGPSEDPTVQMEEAVKLMQEAAEVNPEEIRYETRADELEQKLASMHEKLADDLAASAQTQPQLSAKTRDLSSANHHINAAEALKPEDAALAEKAAAIREALQAALEEEGDALVTEEPGRRPIEARAPETFQKAIENFADAHQMEAAKVTPNAEVMERLEAKQALAAQVHAEALERRADGAMKAGNTLAEENMLEAAVAKMQAAAGDLQQAQETIPGLADKLDAANGKVDELRSALQDQRTEALAAAQQQPGSSSEITAADQKVSLQLNLSGTVDQIRRTRRREPENDW